MGDAGLEPGLIIDIRPMLSMPYLETLLYTHFTGGETETQGVKLLTELSAQDSVRFL